MTNKFYLYLSAAAFICLAASENARAERPYGIDQRVPIGPFVDGHLPAKAIVQTGKWAAVEAFPKLTFDDPTVFVAEPRSNRLYVGGRQGTIFWFENDPNTSEKHEFLDLTDVTQGWDDCGLLGIAFHPEFGQPESPNRGYVYVWYQYSPHPIVGPKRPPVNTPAYNRLSRFTVPDGSHAADRNSEQVLINQLDHNVWHNGGGMFFGPDKYLYLSLGDEGGVYDQFKNSQTISRRLFSGAVRIDVDCDATRSHPIRRQPQPEEKLPDGYSENSYTAHYYIPNDNPFLDEKGGLLEEFYALGLRNPHRMTLDPPTGRIWVGDVGQDKWEEVDVLKRGGNYQWAYIEAFHPCVVNGVEREKPPADKYIGIETPPIYEYAHGMEGNCVIGGYVYRGKKFAELEGRYVFGDNGSGRIWALDWDGTNKPTIEFLCHTLPGASYSGISSFGIDRDNEIYICKMGRPSKIRKFAHG